MKRVILVIVAALVFAGACFAIDEKKVIDLTYPFDDKTMHWPTAQPFKLDKVNEGLTPLGFWYSSYNYSASEHVGTHLDAPFHFAEGKWTTDQIPIEKLIGPAIVIDVSAKANKNADYLLQIDDLRAWEKSHGRMPVGAVIIVHTGWGRFWGDRKRYFGTDQPGDVVNLHFPGVSKEAAEFLLRERGIDAIGIDTPSIDHGPSRDFVAHQIFGRANTPIFENVANTERLPPKGATIIAMPMKIKGGSGAPLRIIALLP
jgi:kynurenine formamidase